MHSKKILLVLFSLIFAQACTETQNSYIATSFNQDISRWQTQLAKTTGIFSDSGMSQENYCKVSNAWNRSALGMDYTCH
ncbi:MAG: hypothetical protein II767_08785 [Proteobacteria bacterium]|nr:hypothetical protein [Pseudomonadota bacterium]